jgi:hypothetical protein
MGPSSIIPRTLTGICSIGTTASGDGGTGDGEAPEFGVVEELSHHQPHDTSSPELIATIRDFFIQYIL